MDHWRLGHRPALDGLRGIAVLLVVAGHAFIPGMYRAGGPVGVTMFFVLSGFLITGILLDDTTELGRIRFSRFYTRRALRLLPALVAFLAVISVIGLLVPSAPVHPSSVFGSLFYVNNFLIEWGKSDWTGHTWSLAVEEQFYFVWPILLLGLTRFISSEKLRILIIGELAVVAVLLRFMLYQRDGSTAWRIYTSLDTRADALLLGCILAIAMRHITVERAWPLLVVAGLTVSGLTLVWAGADSIKIMVILPLFVALATVAVIFGAAQGAGFVPLSWRPLVWIGQRSYGLYLWHYPVAMTVNDSLDWPWWGKLPVTLGVSFALTVASWHLIEQPFLRMKDRPTKTSGGVVVGVGARV